jgi:hypothetical protein
MSNDNADSLNNFGASVTKIAGEKGEKPNCGIPGQGCVMLRVARVAPEVNFHALNRTKPRSRIFEKDVDSYKEQRTRVMTCPSVLCRLPAVIYFYARAVTWPSCGRKGRLRIHRIHPKLGRARPIAIFLTAEIIGFKTVSRENYEHAQGIDCHDEPFRL